MSDGTSKALGGSTVVADTTKTEAQRRKESPVARGLIAYFPDAVGYVAHVSWVGNEQHNPGQPMHWARSKSSDHLDCLARHLTDHLAGRPTDTDGLEHLGKVAWRALAALQLHLENLRTAAAEPPLAFRKGDVVRRRCGSIQVSSWDEYEDPPAGYTLVARRPADAPADYVAAKVVMAIRGRTLGDIVWIGPEYEAYDTFREIWPDDRRINGFTPDAFEVIA